MTSPQPQRETAEIVGVDWDDPRAAAVRAAMDADMAARYPADPASADRSHAVFAVEPADAVATCLALVDGEAVGHGAMRWLGPDLEIKKIMVLASARGRGHSYAILGWLLGRARTLGASRVVLQTGWHQPESVHVYERLGFRRIPLLAPYADYPRSICFAKPL